MVFEWGEIYNCLLNCLGLVFEKDILKDVLWFVGNIIYIVLYFGNVFYYFFECVWLFLFGF